MNLEPYKVLPAAQIPEMRGLWDGDSWRDVLPVSIDRFRSESSDHRPRTQSKLLYDEQTLFGIFRVDDQYVRSVHTGFQSDVWKDSCVELFIQPRVGTGYFNFEFNCGGALLASYVTNSSRVNGRLQGYTPLAPEDDCQIGRFTSLAPMVEPEIETSLTWYLEFAIPLSIMEKYAGMLENIQGSIWRANFYKCGSETSHPHWASWMPIPKRNFHDPASFGRLIFESFLDNQKGQRCSCDQDISK